MERFITVIQKMMVMPTINVVLPVVKRLKNTHIIAVMGITQAAIVVAITKRCKLLLENT